MKKSLSSKTSTSAVLNRVVIDRIWPEVDRGRHPAKGIQGANFKVSTVIICDGHDHTEGKLFYRHEKETKFYSLNLVDEGNDIWSASFRLEKLGRYSFYTTGSMVGPNAKPVKSELRIVVVEPAIAGFSSWYEFFPRSTALTPGRHGSFKTAEPMLEYAADLGFNVVYLPPIHPIGRSHRKGKNNTLQAKNGDVGSPWAIGAKEGGHKSVHPDLGTLEDFDGFLARAQKLKLKIALDIAFQCSPDHPYVSEHPEWFKKRADGTIQCAENPPKKYEDIYPFDFFCEERAALWNELKSVFIFWIEHGIDVFRVDNPHTKPFAFWEWVIAEIKAEHPQVIFLSEAFTRPHIMKYLAKVGFSQSYTYFTWRTTKEELKTYATEVIDPDLTCYFRANFWPNTPDILATPLKNGTIEDFKYRAVLAATLCSNYGVYGPAFELADRIPRNEKTDENIDSEKYELKTWDIKSPTSIAPLIKKINQIRNSHRVFQSMANLRFHPVNNEKLIAYSNHTDDGKEIFLTVVNLHPEQTQIGSVHLNLAEFAPFLKSWGEQTKLFAAASETALNSEFSAGNEKKLIQKLASLSYLVHDVLNDAQYIWNGDEHYIELNPKKTPAHIFRIELPT